MMTLDQLRTGAEQPSILALGAEPARALFKRDLGRGAQFQRARRELTTASERQRFDLAMRAKAKQLGPMGLRLPKRKREQRFKPSDPTGYMLDAIGRDNALAQYDREVPMLRTLNGL